MLVTLLQITCGQSVNLHGKIIVILQNRPYKYL